MFKPTDFFDLSQTGHAGVFAGVEFAWEALLKIKTCVEANVKPALLNKCEGDAFIGERVFIGDGTVVEDGAMIRGPAIIGRNCQIRHNAYIREHVIVGDNCIVGNSTELKNTLMLDGAAAPHYNYCGDSILGNRTNLGAGTKLSNYKIAADKTIRLRVGDQVIDTGLEKFGAILGDNALTGCNSVLNPGTILGKNVMVYACAAVRGFIPHNTVVKLRQEFDYVPVK